MKFAIISDIHSNLEALKATLNDISKRDVDKIICIGDIIAKGTHVKECLDLVRQHCDIVIQGNCDRHFSATHDLTDPFFSEQEKTRIQYNQSRLTMEDREYLSNLPFCFEFYMSGSYVRLFHATPQRDNIPLINLDSIQDKYNMFLPTEKTVTQKIADVVIYGHIHHPYMDRLYNKTLINVGSVGNSFDVIRNDMKDSDILETTRSNYLIIEGKYGSTEYHDDITFQFIRVPYDIDKELKDENLNIEKENHRCELIQGKYRDMSKINAYYTKLGIDINKI
ncbi:MAG: metallophosphoesterase family protein [Clostridia bacterium]|nr:metallophosphoesterase family protein [Clostridia bacterium]